jgi:uncharacterized membrane protein
MDVADFFSDEQKHLVKAAIERLEQKTSGEIRLHVEGDCEGDAYERALHVFHKLHMQKTKHRNAVLFYLAVNHKKFAIVGDEGIHKSVPENFWATVKDHVISQFKQGKFTEGICEGIDMTGEMLKTHFPHNMTDKNQLSDEISYGKQ